MILFFLSLMLLPILVLLTSCIGYDGTISRAIKDKYREVNFIDFNNCLISKKKGESGGTKFMGSIGK